MLKIISMFLMFFLISGVAWATPIDDCAALDPRQYVDKSVNVGVKVKASLLQRLLGEGELDAEKKAKNMAKSYDKTTNDVENRILYQFCIQVNKSDELSDKEKLEWLMKVAIYVRGTPFPEQNKSSIPAKENQRLNTPLGTDIQLKFNDKKQDIATDIALPPTVTGNKKLQIETKKLFKRATKEVEKELEREYKESPRIFGKTTASPWYRKGEGEFIGALQDGVKDFCGIELYSSGSFYVGWFKLGKRNGFGVQYNSVTKKHRVKEFDEGSEIFARKVAVTSLSSGRKYIGEKRGKTLYGRAIIKYTDENIFLGRFRNNNRVNDGCYFDFKNKLINVYTYKNGKKINSIVIK